MSVLPTMKNAFMCAKAGSPRVLHSSDLKTVLQFLYWTTGLIQPRTSGMELYSYSTALPLTTWFILFKSKCKIKRNSSTIVIYYWTIVKNYYQFRCENQFYVFFSLPLWKNIFSVITDLVKTVWKIEFWPLTYCKKTYFLNLFGRILLYLTYLLPILIDNEWSRSQTCFSF